MGLEPGWTDRRRWAPDQAVVAEVRAFVSTQLVSHGHPGLVSDAALVVSELATNAVVHARTPFEVTLNGTERRVLVQVSDGSPRPPATGARPALATAGRGLLLVEELADSWGISRNVAGGKSVWASFLLAPTPAGSGG